MPQQFGPRTYLSFDRDRVMRAGDDGLKSRMLLCREREEGKRKIELEEVESHQLGVSDLASGKSFASSRLVTGPIEGVILKFLGKPSESSRFVSEMSNPIADAGIIQEHLQSSSHHPIVLAATTDHVAAYIPGTTHLTPPSHKT